MELKTTRFLILFLFEPRLYTLFFETIKAFAFRIDSRLNFFFFGSMLLRSFNDESSEVIAKDFFNLYFFPFSVGKKRSLRRRIRDLSCIVSSWPFIFVPFFSLFVSLNSCILCWASRPIDTTSSSLNFATRAHFPWQWQSVDDQAIDSTGSASFSAEKVSRLI